MAEPFRVSSGYFSNHQSGTKSTENFDYVIVMPAHEPVPFWKRRFRLQRSGIRECQGMAEYPGIIKGAPADTHSLATGTIDHHAGSLRSRHVAVSDHRDG